MRYTSMPRSFNDLATFLSDSPEKYSCLLKRQMVMTVCPECNGNLYDYFELKNGFTEYVCLKCGYYSSNSPAFYQIQMDLKI